MASKCKMEMGIIWKRNTTRYLSPFCYYSTKNITFLKSLSIFVFVQFKVISFFLSSVLLFLCEEYYKRNKSTAEANICRAFFFFFNLNNSIFPSKATNIVICLPLSTILLDNFFVLAINVSYRICNKQWKTVAKWLLRHLRILCKR